MTLGGSATTGIRHWARSVSVVDPADPRLDLYRGLNDPPRRARVEAEHSIFVVEGRLTVERLLTSPYPIHSLLIDDRQITTSSDLVTTRGPEVPGVRGLPGRAR